MDTTTHTTTNTVKAEALRAAARFIEANPHLPVAYVVSHYKTVQLDYFLFIDFEELAEQKSVAAEIIRSIGGKWDKQELGDRFVYTTTVNGLKINISVTRDAVCERVVTGTETVTIPATDAVEAQPERTEVRDIVEWRCLPLLAEDGAA